MARHQDHRSRRSFATVASSLLKSLLPGSNPGKIASSLMVCVALMLLVLPTDLHAASRSLTLHNTHTKETTTITYKRNGKFDADGLRKLNRFLRDWRRNESTQMDPALFDLIWEVYKDTGAKKPIYVVSGYRSPATNNMLRSRSSGVAKNSRHTKGQAMDFYLPGVPIQKIRDVGLRLQAGGVGYYPTSRSPFVHIDTGNVRHWPRMTRKQLARVFPNGKTVHVPSDGKPFSGYQQAKAEVARTKSAMIRSSRSVGRFTQEVRSAPASRTTAPTRVASATQAEQDQGGTLLQRLLNRTPKEPPKPSFETAGASATAAAQAADAAMPQSLASLPRTPENRPEPVVETPALDLALDADDDAAEAEQDAEQVNTEGPVMLASLPRVRPNDLMQTTQVADTPDPQATDPQATDPQPDQIQELAAASATEETASPTDETPAPEIITLAALPKPRTEQSQAAEIEVASNQPANSNPAPIEEAAPIAEAPADATQILANMAGSEPAASSDAPSTRVAYASSGQGFIAALPSNAPRPHVAQTENKPDLNALPRNADRTQLASLAPTAAPAAQIAAPVANRAATSKATGSQDQLSRLTFAYGQSGMAHFAHMKQSTKTATFARLSRPIPNNLRALVSKPGSIIDQTFSHHPSQLVEDAHFVGPAIARMAVRSFN